MEAWDVLARLLIQCRAQTGMNDIFFLTKFHDCFCLWEINTGNMPESI